MHRPGFPAFSSLAQPFVIPPFCARWLATIPPLLYSRYSLFFLAVFLPYTALRLFGPKRNWSGEIPSTYPYLVPVLAHALPFAWDMPGFMEKVAKRSKGVPVLLRLFVVEMFLITAGEDILALLNQSQNLTNKAYRHLAVKTMFGLSKEASDFIFTDDSGLNKKPLPTSNRKPEHRIEYLTHTTLSKFLTGPGLKPLVARYTAVFSHNLSKIDLSQEWTQFPDLFGFLQEQMFTASAEALFGPHILSLNQALWQDFAEFDQGFFYLAKGLPRWMCPKLYGARDRCLEHFKAYHHFIKSHPRRMKPTGAAESFDPYSGAEVVRSRQDMWSKMSVMDPDAQASEDFGFLWGANHNASHTAFWLLSEILHSPRISKRFRDAVSLTRPTGSDLDPAALISSPYLSSIYAETLRFRSADTILRGPNRKDIHVGKWLIPQGKVVAISLWTVLNDNNVWNTGSKDEPHPLREFWDERFLISQDGRLTGPSKNGLCQTQKMPHVTSDTPPGLRFSTDGLGGSFIPYGGGQNMCPGRMFAKQEILFTLAKLLLVFDMEVQGPEPKMSFKAFGTGILGPERKTPFKIRRRHV